MYTYVNIYVFMHTLSVPIHIPTHILRISNLYSPKVLSRTDATHSKLCKLFSPLVCCISSTEYAQHICML